MHSLGIPRARVAGVYAVLGRRRARIVREELREGSGHFSVHAFLPMQERPVARAVLVDCLSSCAQPMVLENLCNACRPMIRMPCLLPCWSLLYRELQAFIGD